MRISDWSSDVCSSDLVPNAVAAKFHPPSGADRSGNARPYVLAVSSPNAHKNFARMVAAFLSLEGFDDVELHIVGDRSAKRRGGKECVSTCRYRWSQYH